MVAVVLGSFCPLVAERHSSSYSSSRIGTQTEVASHLLLCAGRVGSPVPLKHSTPSPKTEKLIDGAFLTRSRFPPSSASSAFPAASQDILDPGRGNSNASELVSPTHRAVRFALVRSSRADLRATESFRVTSLLVPKNISFGVCPWNAECGITSLCTVTQIR